MADDPRDQGGRGPGGPAPTAPGPSSSGEAEPATGAPSPVAAAGDGGEALGPPLGELIAAIDREVAAAGEAATRGEAAPEAPGRRLLLFSLAGTRCAVGLDHLVELGSLPRVTPVPNLPPWVRGVTNLRGDILAVADLAAFFAMTRPAGGDYTRLLVVRSHREEVTTGLLADEVHGLIDLPASGLRAPAAPIEDRVSTYLEGVVEHEGRLVSVLDLERLLGAPEFRQFEAA